MGVDVYMNWEGKTEADKEAQVACGFHSTGRVGYLRGAYFGGLSDVLRELFDWMDWDKETPFDPVQFEIKLQLLKANKGARPGSGRFKFLENAPRGWDSIHKRQEEPISLEDFKEYDDFLALGKRLIAEGKHPTIIISY